MDWLSQHTGYLDSDLNQFESRPTEKFRIRTVTLKFTNKSQKKPVEYETQDFRDESDYSAWVAQSRSSLQDQPTFFLVLHERQNDKYLPRDKQEVPCAEQAKTVSHSKEILEFSTSNLYQHRSLALCMPRTSTVIFNSRRVEWDCDESKEQSIVYNCRSDTQTLGFNDDVLLSTTYFKNRPWTTSVMYGCPTDLFEDIPPIMRRFKKSAFHPLMMPMVFAEHERTRFKEAMELDGPKLKQRIMDLKNMLQADKLRKAEKNRAGRREDNRVTTEQDCEDTKLWDEVSQLKIGMESFRKMLLDLEQQFTTFGDLELRSGTGGTSEKIVDSISSDYIKCRLKEMVAELDTNIRQCEGLLAGMTLALQVAWNYYTKRDSLASIIIAHASHEDSAQMKLMSLVGMIFLPGTFLATLFSMSFFRWIPDDSPEMVSPYVAIYFGLTLIITAVTVRFWVWKSKGKDGNDEKTKRIYARIAAILDDMLDSDGMLDLDDVEKGLEGSSSSRNSRFSSDPRYSSAFEKQIGTGM